MPDIELPATGDKTLKLSDLRGQRVVLYFYPKDDTPGCTMEGLEFSDLMNEFEGLNAMVIGVSKDTCVSHAAFRDKYGISVRLLADVEGQLCDAYGVWQEKEKHGEKRMGIVRSTFVVDADGKIPLGGERLVRGHHPPRLVSQQHAVRIGAAGVDSQEHGRR